MTRSRKIRLDVLVVERGLADSRERAQRMIRAGQIRAAGRALDKPGLSVDPDIAFEVEPLHDRFVSRGGWKLEAAFEAFPGLTPCPAVCVDVGSSTGGFSDCLLQHGARRVYAIDVGAGSIAQQLREDPRVVLIEKTNARYLTAASLPEPVNLVVCDVAFISLELILGPAVSLLEPGAGQIVVLVKPQFEAGPERVGKGGVVRDPQTHRDVLGRIVEFAPTVGLRAAGLIPSPIKGPAGNREYLLWLPRAQPGGAEVPVDESRIAAAVQAAFAI